MEAPWKRGGGAFPGGHYEIGRKGGAVLEGELRREGVSREKVKWYPRCSQASVFGLD